MIGPTGDVVDVEPLMDRNVLLLESVEENPRAGDTESHIPGNRSYYGHYAGPAIKLPDHCHVLEGCVQDGWNSFGEEVALVDLDFVICLPAGVENVDGFMAATTLDLKNMATKNGGRLKLKCEQDYIVLRHAPEPPFILRYKASTLVTCTCGEIWRFDELVTSEWVDEYGDDRVVDNVCHSCMQQVEIRAETVDEFQIRGGRVKKLKRSA